MSFISQCCACWGIKALRLRYRRLVPALISTCPFFSLLRGLNFDCFFFRPPSISATAAIIAHPTVWLLRMREISLLAVFYVSLCLARPEMHICFSPTPEDTTLFCFFHANTSTFTSVWGAVSAFEKWSSSGACDSSLAKSWQRESFWLFWTPESYPQAYKLNRDHRTGSGLDQLTSPPRSTGMNIRWKSQLNWHFESPVA